MGQLLSFFKRRENDDFEGILNELEDSIRTKEEHLAFVKQRERRAVVLFTSYSILLWALYALALWFGALEWAGFIGKVDEHGESYATEDLGTKILATIPVGGVPILIFFTRRIVKAWYRRKQEAENKQLTVLRKKQRDQIDKLKKLSNYDKITEMLQRHGQASPRPAGGPGVPFGQMPGTPSKPGGSKAGSVYSTPVGAGKQPLPFGPGMVGGVNMTPAQQKLLSQQKQQGSKQAPLHGKKMFPAPPGPGPLGVGGQAPPLMLQGDPDQIRAMTPPPQPKTFIDRVADVLLGGDEQSPSSKYALICQKCFAHNGLALKDELMDVQFVCPKCGHFNPSRRSRMTGAPPPQPALGLQGAPGAQKRLLSKLDNADADESTSLDSPTMPMHGSSRLAASQERSEDGQEDVSMARDESEVEDEQDERVSAGSGTMKPRGKTAEEERRDKLRRRTSSKQGSGAREKGGSDSGDQ